MATMGWGSKGRKDVWRRFQRKACWDLLPRKVEARQELSWDMMEPCTSIGSE